MEEMQSMEKSSGALSSEHKTAKVGIFRRNSTGDGIMKSASSPVSSEEKVVSRYLRASTGSCHDFCKYGGRHVFDSKEYPVSLLFRKRGSAGKQKDKRDAFSVRNRKQKPDAKLMKSAPILETVSSLKMSCDSSQRDLVEDFSVVSDSAQNDLMGNFPVVACPGGSEDMANMLVTTTALEPWMIGWITNQAHYLPPCLLHMEMGT